MDALPWSARRRSPGPGPCSTAASAAPHRNAVEVLWELEPGAGLERFCWADGGPGDRAAIAAQLEEDAPPGTRIAVRDGGPGRWVIEIDEAHDPAAVDAA